MLSESILSYAPAILKLLKGPIYRDDADWSSLQNHLKPIREYFNQIGLEVRNYEADGFAYLEQPPADPDDPSKPLPRLMQSFTLGRRTTVLCVLLREELRKHSQNSTGGRLIINLEKIREMLKFYLPDGNNEDRFRDEVKRLVNRVEDLGFLKKLSSEDQTYEVLPILKAIIDADTLERIKQKLEENATLTSE